MPQWGAHYIDLVHFMTGLRVPLEPCVCLAGIFSWKDENKFTAPDQVQALWTYPQGFMVSYLKPNSGNNSSATCATFTATRAC